MNYATESFTGIRPTNDLTVANIIGGVSPILDLEAQGRAGFVFLAEYHAATTVDPHDVAVHSKELTRTLLASGVDSEIYSQRAVGDLVFNAEGLIRGLTTGARLVRIPTLKDIYRDSDNPLNAGIDRIMYPMLMAADILLGRPREVPTGKDQKPHLEIANELIRTFNSRFDAELPLPESRIVELPNIMSLDNSGRKMSKSIPGGAIFINDKPAVARKKVMKAITASKPGPQLDSSVNNLYNIAAGLASAADIEVLQATQELGVRVKEGDKKLGQFKSLTGDIVATYLANFQERRESVTDASIVERVEQGSSKFREIGEVTLSYMLQRFWR